MSALSLVLLAAFQQQPAAPAAPKPALAPSPITRLAITPGSKVTMTAGDTLRLRVAAYDAGGKPVENVSYKYFPAGGYFEGKVDSTGLISSGSTGAMGVSVIAAVPGTKPFVEKVDVRMVPGPATRIAVQPSVGKLVVGQRLRLGATTYSAANDPRDDKATWTSSAPGIARVGTDGVVTAVAPGRATLTARTGTVEQKVPVQVISNTISSIELTPERSEGRTGDVIRFSVTARDRNGGEIKGLTPTWSFSPGNGAVDPDGAFVGYAPGAYLVTASFGARSADASVTLKPRDIRRPVTVLGRVARTRFTTEEVWVMPDGKHAYLGSGSGGDVLYAIDISDPSKPVVTDSIITNTRRVNDVMSTPDGKVIVFTREGASDRKNGIVIASAEDPKHPKVIAEFTEGVNAGVHSAFIFQQEKYGTHVYLTNDGTGAMHVIDISDPYKPKEVAQWRTARPDAGRTLHDIDVQDGLAYLSYWNDGLVVLDIGNGVKGGRPDNPVLVTQYKYDLNAMYRDVEAVAGPGFIRGTHTAWRHKNYVFIADEVFPAGAVKGAKDASAFRAYGNLQVIDISDVDKPKAVAWYQPEFGGVHNIWVAGDTLYMGAYNAGFRAFDISGELRGDLRAQGREFAHLHTGDMEGKTQNSPMTWGVVVKDGLAYVNDMNNGLWIVRLEPRREDLTP
jgi:hypothetical protein